MANEREDKIEGAASASKPGKELSQWSSAEAVKAFEEAARHVLAKTAELKEELKSHRADTDIPGLEFSEEKANGPAPDDIGKIVAAAVKGRSYTASILEEPALNDISDIVAAAKEVFGPDRGLRWLGTPVPALEYATPISLVETEAGRQKIHDALVNLTHGNW